MSPTSGYITPAVLGVPNALKRGMKSAVDHNSACWLHSPCRVGVPNASKRGTKSEVAHKRAWCLHNPYHLGDFKAGDENRSGPNVGVGAT